MRGSFLEYAYSVIYSRALPDARDGLKPVQRRILFQMAQMGLRPERGHVKSARVVGEVMGRLHPHGDSAIYDALVRMAQPFSLRLPMIDGHGNFGSLDDGPAAMRYTECRLAPAASTLVANMDEDVVDFTSNYDGRELEPVVLPAAVPVLLINGAAGIAVGMATNMPPHNLTEVCSAAKHLLRHPKATLDELMEFVPGPDLPTGGQILGREGIRDAYRTGKGSFRIRAATRIEQVSPRRKGIVVTALPYGVGPERIVEKMKELVQNKKLEGISDLIDLTDGERGLHLVIEIKSGFSPEAVRENLYRLTPLEDQFNVNNVALVQGQPRTLGLVEMLQVFLDFRIDVITRRSQFRRTKAMDRMHLVDGLLIAILDIDEVVALIRSSENAAVAKTRLMNVFDLSDVQATYILDMPLRRLTKYSRLELEQEKQSLTAQIAELTRILDNPSVLRSLLAKELDAAAAEHGTPRRTQLLDAVAPVRAAIDTASLEVPDEPCKVVLTCAGLLARTATAAEPPLGETSPTALAAITSATTRGHVAVITSTGRAHRINVVELPMTSSGHSAAGAPVNEYCSLERGERPLGLIPLEPDCDPTGLTEAAPAGTGQGIAVGTAQGIVKRVADDVPNGKDIWPVITLRPGDQVVGVALSGDQDDLVFVSNDAQLLRFQASSVRPQGRAAGGMAGIRLAPGACAVFFGAVPPDQQSSTIVVTIAGGFGQLTGTSATSAKVSSLAEYPHKGRATGGVRCQRLTKGEDGLVLAWVGPDPARAETDRGKAVALPNDHRARDAAGVKLTSNLISVVGGIHW
ncbi:MAG: DNA topoisomerase IV subunit A [Actinomycetes bacterium]